MLSKVCLQKKVLVKGGKFKAVAGLFLACLVRSDILDMIEPGGVGIILGVGAVGDYKNLHILIKARGSPEAVPLITFNLIERLPDGYAPPLEFDMDHWEAVHKHRYVIAIVMGSPFLFGNSVLIDDLQPVVVNILLINQRDVFAAAIVPAQHLNMVLLDEARLFHNAIFGIGQHLAKKAAPLLIGKTTVVDGLQLTAEVVNQVFFRMNGQILIPQFLQQANKLLFQRCFALVRLRALGLGLVFGYDGAFAALRDNVEIAHIIHLRLSKTSFAALKSSICPSSS